MGITRWPVRVGEVWKISEHEKLTNVHRFEDCLGPCPLHYPSEHKMLGLPLHFRQDAGLFERICEHGIGHPDPDSLEYIKQMTGSDAFGVHGCDGCCRED